MADAFFRTDGGRLVSTELTRGPWNDLHMHGGPPAALLGRAIERLPGLGAVARMTFELLRPVPLGEVEVTAAVLQVGKSVQRSQATLWADGVERMRVQALHLQVGTLGTPPSRHRVEAAAPAALADFTFPFFRAAQGYHRAVNVKYARGSFGDDAVTVWMRPAVALVEGEALSPLQRTLVCIDAQSGLCPPVDVDRFTFVNPDLTLCLERPLEGDWLGLHVRSAAQASGVGLAEAQLFDGRGVLGRSAQMLIVRAR